MTPELNSTHLRWSGRTHPGRFRQNNEDTFLALTFDHQQAQLLGKDGEATLEMGDFIFAVSDGMGGANAGEFASRIAADKIKALLPRSFQLQATGLRRGGHDLLAELFSAIHREMRAMGRHYEECRGMGATLTLCWFAPEKVYFAHIGDSRLYYLPAESGIRQLSHDHTYVGKLVRSGQLSESQARFHPRKHILNQGLGANFSDPDPQIGVVNYLSGDRFLLCSDGVSDGCGPASLESRVRNALPQDRDKPPAERIVAEALLNAGQDNITALVIEVD